jgi:hypothetical protein
MGLRLDQIAEGDRVALTRAYGEHPFPEQIPEGAAGLVTEIFPGEGMVNIRMDDTFDFLDEWENHLQIAPEGYGFGIDDDGTYPLRHV